MRLVFSSRCGRVRLTNVTVRNAGIDWEHPDNVYWRHMVSCSASALSLEIITDRRLSYGKVVRAKMRAFVEWQWGRMTSVHCWAFPLSCKLICLLLLIC